ncbi:hypothetical protein DFH11DRAFT_1691977 [Phellopilus nigrolimitatus]|nr:hypothetical protein DFH11DRAFT_1691977 [Phellopilus nigrolimitatus]
MSSAGASTSLDLIIGPLLLGTVFDAFVLGICVIQVKTYVSSGYKDDWKLVALLTWVILIDTFQSGAATAMLWHYVVDNFSNVAALGASPWEYATLPIFSSLAAVPIQHFMAWRIMRFSKSRWLFVYISVLSLGQGALACASAVLGLISPDIAEHVKIILIADVWLGMSVACDTSITVLLLWYLNKSRTGFKRTDSIIFRLCRITGEAALPVSLLCILDLVFLTTTPFKNLHFMCAMPVGRLYTNTLLTTLNARESLRKTMESSIHNSYQLNSRDLNTRIGRGSTRTTEVHINVLLDVGLTSGSGDELTYTETTPSTDHKSNFA